MYVNAQGKFWNNSYQDVDSNYRYVMESWCVFIVIFLLVCNFKFLNNEIVCCVCKKEKDNRSYFKLLFKNLTMELDS